jgi:L-arabinokinase
MMNRERRPLVYYISAHGYGHGVRSCDIISALRERFPQLPVTVVSGLPEEFFVKRLGPGAVVFRRASFDVGLVQRDSIRADVPATLASVEELYARRAALVDGEARFLDGCRAAVVVADIPAIPIAAARARGLPAVAVGNFTWDWIYAGLDHQGDRWRPLIETLRHDYAQADLLLRLPFAGDMSGFRRIEDVPLLAEAGRDRRASMASRFGIDPGKTWVLLSFTSLDWDADAVRRVSALDDFAFVTVKPLEWQAANFVALDPAALAFRDIVASVDVVVSKPGFGIVSECIASGTPIVYADRGDFVEYPVLVAGIEEHLRNVHVPSERLYEGDLAPYLEAVSARPAPTGRLPRGGSRVAAHRMASFHPEFSGSRAPS